LRKCYKMNPRFDLATIEKCSEIPACRGREILSLLIWREITGDISIEFLEAPVEYS
jgi:hypothetical protein